MGFLLSKSFKLYVRIHLTNSQGPVVLRDQPPPSFGWGILFIPPAPLLPVFSQTMGNPQLFLHVLSGFVTGLKSWKRASLGQCKAISVLLPQYFISSAVPASLTFVPLQRRRSQGVRTLLHASIICCPCSEHRKGVGDEKHFSYSSLFPERSLPGTLNGS